MRNIYINLISHLNKKVNQIIYLKKIIKKLNIKIDACKKKFIDKLKTIKS